MRILILVVLLLAGCGGKNVTVKGAEIQLPPLPDRVEIEQPNMPKKQGTIYLNEPTKLKPNESWKAPEDGAVVWKNKDLRGILYGLTQYPKWMDKASQIVSEHNKKIDSTEEKKPWYRRMF